MKLIIADDHDLVRDALTTLIERDDPSSEVLQAPDFPGALELATRHDDLDLALLDVYMPGMDKLAGVRKMTQRCPDLPVVVMSGMVQRGDVTRAFDMGAKGFIPKTMNGKALVSVLHLVMSGARYVPDVMLVEEQDVPGDKFELSRREMEVLEQLVKGLANKVIARNLGIEETTVKLHLRSLFRKLGVNNRTEAVIVALDSGLFAAG